MKKIFTLAMIATILFYGNDAAAKIRRVGYFGTPIAGTDYTTLQAAHDSAKAKDTILLFPGSWSAYISKKIVVLGYGYFLTGTGANSNLQNIKGTLSAAFYLKAGADSSVYEGIDGIDIYPYYQQKVDKVIVRRCNGSVRFNDQIIDSWQIMQSNLTNLSYVWGGGRVTNLKVSNSYIASLNIYYVGTASQSTGQFVNDIFSYTVFGYGSFIVKNSIFIQSHYYDDNCVYQNSVANTYYGTIPTGSGNKNITYASMTTDVFVGYSAQDTYSNDARWALKSGSPAKGAGAGGTDAGIFGGANPYKLSGIPRIPSFYKLTAPSTTTGSNPYTITFSVRSNN